MGKLLDTYWPEMTSAAMAERSIQNAANMAYFVAAVTTLLASLAWFGVFHLISPGAVLDALIFVIVGFFISRGSKVAAILGLVLYGLEVINRVISGVGGFSIVGVIFTLYFVNGVRGSFALVMLRQHSGNVTPLSLTPSQHQRSRRESVAIGIRNCPSCGTKVLPTADGLCPACRMKMD